MRNYEKYLTRAKTAGIKSHFKGNFVIALFMFILFSTYSYAFFMGSIWIEKEIYNNTFKRPYKSGDILSCFFGVIFGMFSIGMALPSVKAVIEGRVAGKMAFDIIERKPRIDQDEF